MCQILSHNSESKRRRKNPNNVNLLDPEKNEEKEKTKQTNKQTNKNYCNEFDFKGVFLFLLSCFLYF